MKTGNHNCKKKRFSDRFMVWNTALISMDVFSRIQYDKRSHSEDQNHVHDQCPQDRDKFL